MGEVIMAVGIITAFVGGIMMLTSRVDIFLLTIGCQDFKLLAYI